MVHMGRSRVLGRVAGLAAGAVAAGGLMASPVHAADLGTYDGCVSGAIQWGQGDSVVIVWDPAVCSYQSGTIDAGVTTSQAVVDGDVCWTLTWASSGSDQRFDLTADNGARSYASDGVGPTTFEAAVCGSGASASTAAAIPSWVQAYGRDRDATCEEGWVPSWQEWAQSVTGGWVCTRSIPSLG